jgi:hypothetical protein
MRLRTISILGVLLLAIACDPAEVMKGQAGALDALKDATGTQAAPSYPAPGTCTTDNSDPNYTCKTCTSAGGGVITITCTPKTKTKAFW